MRHFEFSYRCAERVIGEPRLHVRAPGLPKPQPRRGSKLDPYQGYIQGRLAENVFNCTVLLRELRQLGYTGGCTILKDHVKPLRRCKLPVATMWFETKPGEQAQIDWGTVRYKGSDGTERSLYAFVMVLGWSRAAYVEFTPKADMVSFLKCHLHAFEELGIPQHCLYDNTKLVTLGRGEDGEVHWNPRFLDFSRRMGFDPDLCQQHRAGTKGKVEDGIKYVKGNFWPSAKFTDLADLNQRARAWVRGTANPRVHMSVPWTGWRANGRIGDRSLAGLRCRTCSILS